MTTLWRLWRAIILKIVWIRVISSIFVWWRDVLLEDFQTMVAFHNFLFKRKPVRQDCRSRAEEENISQHMSKYSLIGLTFCTARDVLLLLSTSVQYSSQTTLHDLIKWHCWILQCYHEHFYWPLLWPYWLLIWLVQGGEEDERTLVGKIHIIF